jgi:hypothetical protein
VRTKWFLSPWNVGCIPCTYLVSRLAVSPNEQDQASTWATSPRSTIGYVQNDFLAYVMFSASHAPILHRHQHYLQMHKNKIPHDPCHHRVPSGACKTIYEAVLRSAQFVHLSCFKISTISERTKPSFHLGLVTKEYHQVCRKRFLSLRYVWHKLCTYLATTVTLSTNGPKWDSTWPMSHSSSILYVQNNYRASSTFNANHAPI